MRARPFGLKLVPFCGGVWKGAESRTLGWCSKAELLASAMMASYMGDMACERRSTAGAAVGTAGAAVGTPEAEDEGGVVLCGTF